MRHNESKDHNALPRPGLAAGRSKQMCKHQNFKLKLPKQKGSMGRTRYIDMPNVFRHMETKHCGEVANKISLFKRLIREKGEKSGRKEKQPKKLGRREKNRGKNREKRNLTVRSSPLMMQGSCIRRLQSWQRNC